MGRGAAGVKGITLREGDHVIEMDVLPAGAEEVVAEESETEEIDAEVAETETETDDENVVPPADSRGYILTITEKGFGKRSPVTSYRLTNRGARGVINIKTTDKNGKVAGIAHVNVEDQVLVITEQGMMIRTNVADMRSMGRATQGVRVINIDENDVVVAAIKLMEREGPEEIGEEITGENGEAAPPPEDEPVH
jgi:DNA gyrase subunit A